MTFPDDVDAPMQAPVLITGARGQVEQDALIEAISAAIEDRQATLQAFDPAAVYGPRHLEAAARRAVRSHREDRAIARDLAVEIALYAAGTSQIDEALATVGVPKQSQAIVLCGIGPDRKAALADLLEALDLEEDGGLVTQDEQALDRLGIPQAARDAVGEDELELLVVEHVALLDARTA